MNEPNAPNAPNAPKPELTQLPPEEKLAAIRNSLKTFNSDLISFVLNDEQEVVTEVGVVASGPYAPLFKSFLDLVARHDEEEASVPAAVAAAIGARCRVCGCTEREPCNPPCSWALPGLCSVCALAATVLGEWHEVAHRPNIAALLIEAVALGDAGPEEESEEPMIVVPGGWR
jgi:hypothetical protein